MELVKKMAHDMALSKVEIDSKQLHKKFCLICKKIREEGLICKMHEEAWPAMGPCKICFD